MPITFEWVNKMWCLLFFICIFIHTFEHYSATEMNEVPQLGCTLKTLRYVEEARCKSPAYRMTPFT